MPLDACRAPRIHAAAALLVAAIVCIALNASEPNGTAGPPGEECCLRSNADVARNACEGGRRVTNVRVMPIAAVYAAAVGMLAAAAALVIAATGAAALARNIVIAVAVLSWVYAFPVAMTVVAGGSRMLCFSASFNGTEADMLAAEAPRRFVLNGLVCVFGGALAALGVAAALYWCCAPMRCYIVRHGRRATTVQPWAADGGGVPHTEV